MHTSQASSRHVLGLTFAKPSSYGPSSHTCTSRAGRPTSTAGRAVRLRIVSSSVGTPGRPSTSRSAFPLLQKTAVPLGMCGTWTCSLTTGVWSTRIDWDQALTAVAERPSRIPCSTASAPWSCPISPLPAQTARFTATCHSVLSFNLYPLTIFETRQHRLHPHLVGWLESMQESSVVGTNATVQNRARSSTVKPAFG